MCWTLNPQAHSSSYPYRCPNYKKKHLRARVGAADEGCPPASRAAALAHLLGGSWVVISGVISPLIWVINTVTLLITPLITTHEPPSWWRKGEFTSEPTFASNVWAGGCRLPGSGFCGTSVGIGELGIRA